MRSSNCRSVDWRYLDSQLQSIPQYDYPQSCISKIKNTSKTNYFPSQPLSKSTSTNQKLLAQQQQLYPLDLKPESEQLQQQPSGYRKPRDNLRQKNNRFLTQNTVESKKLYESTEIMQSKEDSLTLLQKIPVSDNNCFQKNDLDKSNLKPKARKNTQHGATLLPIQLNDYRNLLREALQSFIIPPKPIQVPSKAVNLNTLKELLSSKSCFFQKNKNTHINNTLNTKSNRKSEDLQPYIKSPIAFETTNQYEFQQINKESKEKDIKIPFQNRKKTILSPILLTQFLKRDSCPESFLKDSFSCEPMNMCKRDDKLSLPLKKLAFNNEKIKLKASTSQKAFLRRDSLEAKQKTACVSLQFNFTNKDKFVQNNQNFYNSQQLNQQRNHEMKEYEQQYQQQSQENPLSVPNSKINSKISSPPSHSPQKISFVKFSQKNNVLQQSQPVKNKQYLRLEAARNPQEFNFNDIDELQPWKQLNSSRILETFQQEEEEDILKNE